MDRVNEYKQTMHNLLLKLAETHTIDDQNVDSIVVADDQNGQYMLFGIGWRGHERIDKSWVHVRIKNGKLWIEDDWTADGIVTHLKEAGIPNEDIVLAFNPPDMRQNTEYAVV